VFSPPPQITDGAMQTADGRWRVEVIRRETNSWYRLIHDTDVVDLLDLDSVEALLAKAGIAMSALTPAPATVPAAQDRDHLDRVATESH
jgi:hypothetical protein